jgi:ubiquinone/menaquinone biosynthesis C-methylase UbiE
MPFYRDHIYPYLISRLGNPEPIRKVRERIVPLAQGFVLEIGVGPGVNFVYYDPARVSKLYALEPNPGMIRLAELQRRRTGLAVEYLDLPGERIPLADGSVDTVVSTFTLGTIPGVGEAIRELGRVLRPSGKLIFFEVGLSPDPQVRRWQAWWGPIAHGVFQGLQLTRDIPSLITHGGFQIEQMETAYLDESTNAAKAWMHSWWGTAIPQSRSLLFGPCAAGSGGVAP